ncbi:MAG: hypothetical protein JRE23_04420 [Deltaproteobacteria bacterium]|nr:hypothetical protein [Deltaproteobacteria bacterium]
MMPHANNIHWEILETQDHLFRTHSLENPESLIKECQVIKEGHERAVYFYKAAGVYIKCMRRGKAKKEWRNWTRLFEVGLPTIIPIAMGVARNCAYLVSVAPWCSSPQYAQSRFLSSGPSRREFHIPL